MHVTFMRTSPPNPTVHLEGQNLREVQVMKVLGVFIQNNLKWTCHVNEITKRASMRLHMLRILKGFKLPVEDLMTIYCSYVRPALEYCAPVWHSGLDASQTRQVERVQKRACRLMLGRAYVSYEHALSVLNIPTLEKRRESLCMELAKGLTLPSSRFHDWLPPTRAVAHQRSLRNDCMYTEVRCRTERYKKSAIPYLVRLLNKSKRNNVLTKR